MYRNQMMKIQKWINVLYINIKIVICYQKKMFCYFWSDKKTQEPYIGVVKGHLIDHPELEKGNRKQMKIFRINTTEDLPIKTIREILNEALNHY